MRKPQIAERAWLLTEESHWDRLGFVSPNSAIDNQVRTKTARSASAVKQPPRRVNQMALFNSIPPEKKSKTRTKKEEAIRATPAGKARTAKEKGHCSIPIHGSSN